MAVVERSLEEIAQEALDACDGNAKDAARYLVALADRDPRVSQELYTEKWKLMCAYEILARMQLQERAVIWRGQGSPSESSDQRYQDVSRRRLMDIPLSSGVRLGVATKSDILETAERLSKQGKTLMHEARFFYAVAKRVPEGAQAGEVLSEEDLLIMKDQAAQE